MEQVVVVEEEKEDYFKEVSCHQHSSISNTKILVIFYTLTSSLLYIQGGKNLVILNIISQL